ncbi:MAG: hypothetical protein GC149_06715 [Gammaproteobacteria bacterium]|nr:hypothetical protein [Gammaproteobacteria bacterium]
MHVGEMQEQAEHALQQVVSAYHASSQSEQIGPDTLGKSLAQFFAILATIENQAKAPQEVAQDQMQELADHGLGLMDNLNDWAIKLDCDEAQRIFTGLPIPIALWCARQHLPLTQLEPVVNALSKLANSTQDQLLLGEISDAVDVIIDAVTPQIKQDMDKSNPGRPWRVLNLNHGIVATRSHDPKRMEAVFEQLLYRLPEDAPGFFAEGLQQMDLIGYPQHVRTVMEKYYHLTNKPTLH